MKDFGQYEVEDFVVDQDFIRWVFEKRAADNRWWHNWLQQNPEKQSLIEEARTILLSLKIEETAIDEVKQEQQMQLILEKIQERPVKWLLAWSRWQYAAAFLGALIMGAVLYYTTSQSPAMYHGNLVDKDLPGKTNDIIEAINTGKETRVIRLQDGSTVHLAPQSVIRYSGAMAAMNTRDVYLSGEAFFEVTKNPNKPFRVFSQELVTKVLGTSFTVKANADDQQISIIVRTGKVSVYHKTEVPLRKDAEPKNLAGVVLRPNQKLVYARQQQKFEKALVDQPVLIDSSGINHNFHYEDVPVTEVLRQLKRAYGINISYDEEAIHKCRITADLSSESIYKKLELICKALDARYEIVDGQITIEAKSCE